MVPHHGGYDEAANQVFVCANNARREGEVHKFLVGHLLHLFDRCVSKVDHKNLDHIACTEIRKANLTDCNLVPWLTKYD